MEISVGHCLDCRLEQKAHSEYWGLPSHELGSEMQRSKES